MRRLVYPGEPKCHCNLLWVMTVLKEWNHCRHHRLTYKSSVSYCRFFVVFLIEGKKIVLSWRSRHLFYRFTEICCPLRGVRYFPKDVAFDSRIVFCVSDDVGPIVVLWHNYVVFLFIFCADSYCSGLFAIINAKWQYLLRFLLQKKHMFYFALVIGKGITILEVCRA